MKSTQCKVKPDLLFILFCVYNRSIEAAAGIYKEMGKVERAADLIEEACNLYLEHGVPDTALIALEKAGQMLETKDVDRAIRMYLKGIDVAEVILAIGHQSINVNPYFYLLYFHPWIINVLMEFVCFMCRLKIRQVKVLRWQEEQQDFLLGRKSKHKTHRA